MFCFCTLSLTRAAAGRQECRRQWGMQSTVRAASVCAAHHRHCEPCTHAALGSHACLLQPCTPNPSVSAARSLALLHRLVQLQVLEVLPHRLGLLPLVLNRHAAAGQRRGGGIACNQRAPPRRGAAAHAATGHSLPALPCTGQRPHLAADEGAAAAAGACAATGAAAAAAAGSEEEGCSAGRATGFCSSGSDEACAATATRRRAVCCGERGGGWDRMLGLAGKRVGGCGRKARLPPPPPALVRSGSPPASGRPHHPGRTAWLELWKAGQPAGAARAGEAGSEWGGTGTQKPPACGANSRPQATHECC